MNPVIEMGTVLFYRLPANFIAYTLISIPLRNTVHITVFDVGILFKQAVF